MIGQYLNVYVPSIDPTTSIERQSPPSRGCVVQDGSGCVVCGRWRLCLELGEMCLRRLVGLVWQESLFEGGGVRMGEWWLGVGGGMHGSGKLLS